MDNKLEKTINSRKPEKEINEVEHLGHSMDKFPDIPPRGDMTRKHRMKRLERKLVDSGLYVRPVPSDVSCQEWGYFIVAVDDPYDVAQGQDQG